MSNQERNQPQSIAVANSTTNVELLLHLSARNQPESVRRLVAGNPNTPVDILLDLVEEFPHEVAKNAAFKNLKPELSPLFGQMLHPNSKIFEIAIILRNIPLFDINLVELMDRVQSDESAKLFFAHHSCTNRVKYMIAARGNIYLQKALIKWCLK
jgi:hypothetical protein